jgi:HPt (histidine-containing phosphotransfer) domain-containing protein
MNIGKMGKEIGVNKEEFRELLELFLELASADIVRLKEAIQSGSAVQIARIAHTLNGAAGNLGLQKIHEAAKRIETTANLNSLNAVTDDLLSIEKLLVEIRDVLN